MAIIKTESIIKKAMASKTALRSSLAKARAIYEVEEEKLYNQIDAHEVSKELRQDNVVGEYSLFGFLGFQAGTDPVDEIKTKLKESIVFDETPIININNKIASIAYKVSIPSKSETYKMAQTLKWGFSWLYGIENFIPGFEYFVWFRKVPTGRSGLGYQQKGRETISGSQPGAFMSRKDYITGLLKSFAARLQFRKGGRFS